MSSITLSQAVEQYLVLYAAKRSPGSVKGLRSKLRELVGFTGNIFMVNFTSDHVETWLYLGRPGKINAKGEEVGAIQPVSARLAKSSFNQVRQMLKGFEDFCIDKRYARRRFLSNVDRFKEGKHKFQHLNLQQMADVITMAKHPRDRILAGAALFSGLRAQEICSRQIEHVDDVIENLEVQIFKRSEDETDIMPFAPQFKGEIRRWLTFYTESVGDLHTRSKCPHCHVRFHGDPLCPKWYLIPAKVRTPYAKGHAGPGCVPDWLNARLNPTARIRQPDRIAHALLDTIGADAPKEGMHTFRRSAAMLMFDTLVDTGHDHALLVVSRFLHHADIETTIKYLNMDRISKERDRVIREQYRIPGLDTVLGDNVVPLKRAEEGR